jgi:hypothetical protein
VTLVGYGLGMLQICAGKAHLNQKLITQFATRILVLKKLHVNAFVTKIRERGSF